MFNWSRRTTWIVRLSARVVIAFAPIGIAAWHRAPTSAFRGFSEVRSSDPAVARYLTTRAPVMDRLLPAGAGGVRFYQSLDGNAGMAASEAAAIALAVSVASDSWPEAVEMHERAHLLYAFLPDAVDRVMAMRPPANCVPSMQTLFGGMTICQAFAAISPNCSLRFFAARSAANCDRGRRFGNR